MGNLRILIVDDEPHWINFAKSNPDSFEIVAVPDTEKALAQLRTGHFDLVIASSRQLEALDAIRKNFADKPLAVTTVEPTITEARDAYRRGARRYFTKSFDYQDFEKEILGVLPNSS